MASIGKLKEIDVRELWNHEQYDFSNWLSRAENLEYLNEILGLTLTEVNKEVYVGPYRCDLVAKDEISGVTVIMCSRNMLTMITLNAHKEEQFDLTLVLLQPHSNSLGMMNTEIVKNQKNFLFAVCDKARHKTNELF